MDIMEAMNVRHSVRQYEEKPIGNGILEELQKEVDACNQESGLHIQIVTNEPKAFSGFMAHYGSFRGVTNYIALVGAKSRDLDEKCGYYGERLVSFLWATEKRRAIRTKSRQSRKSATSVKVPLTGSNPAWKQRCWRPPL